ncbi:MAG: PQQ-like beta-propeller repeat protein [Streptosporangiales bacterium]|nr:PQQ-like beta-propeller repeat protein [Streptosporangiales bacterium]
MRTLIPAALLAAVACCAAACDGAAASAPARPAAGSATASGSPSPAAPASPAATGGRTGATGGRTEWPTFGQNAARTGAAPGLPRAGKPGIQWRARLDGAVYGQPLVVGGDVIAATENDSVYALNSSTGRVVWRKHLGTPVPRNALHGCGDIFPLGITGTPVYDQATRLVYAVAETTGYRFTLFGLSDRDGAVRVRRAFDLATSRNDPAWDQQRPGLTIGGGRVYAAFGGLTGDCGAYVGAVAGLPASGRGAQVTFFTPTAREGAVWATAGPVTGAGGNLWISAGNGAAESPPYDGSDSVSELSPALRRAAFFSPSTWADDNAGDQDLGSTQPALTPGNSALIVGKRGTGYLLDTRRPGGIGGQLAQLGICPAYGAAAVSGSTVYEPCQAGGTAAVSVDAATRRIRLLWRGPAAADGSPVLGGGAVWVTSYASGSGVLYELDPRTGTIRHELGLGEALPHFSSLSLADGSAYVSALTGVVAVRGA